MERTRRFFRGSISTIAQTPDGYLWIGTEVGLYRFDGVRSVPWQPRRNESLPSNVIRRILAARDGALWIGTENGLARWKDGRLTSFPEFLAQRVDALAEDTEGTVWVGLENVPAWRLCAVRKGAPPRAAEFPPHSARVQHAGRVRAIAGVPAFRGPHAAVS